MSGITAIYNRDGRPGDPALLVRMTNLVSHRGPDKAGYWRDGPIALGHRMFYTTPESLHETQPLCDESNNLVLALDGRVDNREELRTALESHGVSLRSNTDAELVIRAYQYWGEGCPARILGDFAFVLWDRRNQRLFCARDTAGVKPFYYFADDKLFVCGSEIRQILEPPTVPRNPNEGMVAEYLADIIVSRDETFYKGIYRLPPASSLTVEHNKLWCRQYWNIDPSRTVFYRTDAEYSEHFLALFQEAVRCRLRCHGIAGSELSGGLDSSAIVTIGNKLEQEGLCGNSGFEAFALVFPGLACDESAYIDDVANHCGITLNCQSPEATPIDFYLQQALRSLDFPGFPNGAMFDTVNRLANQNNVRVMCTGMGGDEWFTGTQDHWSDLVSGFQWLEMIRQAQSQFGPTGIWMAARCILKNGVWPLLPQGVRKPVRRLIKGEQTPPWLNKSFAGRAGLSERIRPKPVAGNFASNAQRSLYGSLYSGLQLAHREPAERAAGWFGVEHRHPFFDRRIVEFALALPESQRTRDGKTKFILRNALQRILPESVRQRTTKAGFCHVFAESLSSPASKKLIGCLNIAALEWVNGKVIRKMHEKMCHLYAQGNESYIDSVWPVWMVIGVELWYRAAILREEKQVAA